ncbi:GT-D fold domain-containing glycosyltransferase [Latilactobacillus curvatus]|uniref:GT-D fold domain-containing glycosyltransferase n=1 Tax=Latilactobacillus curvatus TaxID=28038 RepID=UPI00202EA8FE|nr:GT-D fold domain-containing glycosyltransferase [Latilactobacillus curvatus]MCM0725987.1 GT-D fold domain-containing glycosyltransferase [Latilactobacillus curvatus]
MYFSKLPIIEKLKLLRIFYYPAYTAKIRKFSFTILSPLETVNLLINENKSISRFGDGEMNIMVNKKSIGFQEYSKELAEELKEASHGTDKRLVAIPHGFCDTKIDKLSVKVFWWSYVVRNFKRINEIFKENLYADASFSRTVTELKNKEYIAENLKKVRRVWENKDVVIIEGEKTRFGVGNDLFRNTKSVSRVIAPAKNAYSRIDDLEKSIEIKKFKSDILVLLAIGPTASVLAMRLEKKGIQAIDIGHFDLQYEYFRRGYYKHVKVENRYDNDIGSTGDSQDFLDEEYENQIIERFD